MTHTVTTHFNSNPENFASDFVFTSVMPESHKAILDEHVKDTIDTIMRIGWDSPAFDQCVEENKILGNEHIDILTQEKLRIATNSTVAKSPLAVDSAILQIKDLIYITRGLSEQLAGQILLVKLWGNMERAHRLESELISTIRERHNELCIQLALFN